jgi:medium-chain acyl-[acyl-carrier-protein] hydrolase
VSPQIERSLANPWIQFRKPRPNPRLRVFCLPYAGGGASTFRDWPRHLPSEIEVCPIQLPGREERIREPSYTRMELLAPAIVEAIEPLLDRPFAFFGHSMGAAVVHAVASILSGSGRSAALLLVSARRAPHLPVSREFSGLPETLFWDELRRLGGIRDEVLRDNNLMQLLTPLLRADFELSERYTLELLSPLDIPIVTYGGIVDADVSRSELAAWSAVTRREFRLRMFSSGHFFLQDQKDQFLQYLARDLAAAMDR